MEGEEVRKEEREKGDGSDKEGEDKRGGEEEEGWCLLLVVLCDGIVQSLETLVVLHLWVCLALCEQLHQAEATVARCQHQSSPSTSVVHHSREGDALEYMSMGVTYRSWPSVALMSAPSLMREEAIL